MGIGQIPNPHLHNLINKIELDKVYSKSKDIIYIDASLANEVNYYFKFENKVNSLESLLIDVINNNKDRNNFTVYKLSKKYEEVSGIKISKSTIYNILIQIFKNNF